MANKTINQLDPNGILTLSDLLEIYQPAQTPKSRKMSLSSLKTLFQTVFASDVFSASGINFPATQIPSSDPNTLDDYEEGTFDPNIQFGVASTGLVALYQYGDYTKKGREVNFSINIVLTALGTATGAVTFELPFVATSLRANYRSPISCYCSSITHSGFLQSVTIGASNIINLYSVDTAGNNTALTDSNFSNSSTVRLAGSYIVN